MTMFTITNNDRILARCPAPFRGILRMYINFLVIGAGVMKDAAPTLVPAASLLADVYVNELLVFLL
jgi:hypothetical protein